MKTPYFLVSTSKIIDNYNKLANKLPVERIYYATKANHEFVTLKTLAEIGSSFEINSSKEIRKLLNMGVTPDRMICSLPIKTIEEIKTMYKLGCRYFVYDDISEYRKLIKYSPDALKIARINVCDISEGDINYGVYEKDIINMIKEKIIPDGYTFYVLNTADRNSIFEKICSIIETLLTFHKSNQPILINLGGNHPLPSMANDDYYKCLSEFTIRLKRSHPNICFIAEPGRSIVDSAFDMVTTVLQVRNGNKVYLDIHSQILKLCPKSICQIDNCQTCSLYTVSFYESLCSNYKLFEMEIDFLPKQGTKLLIKSCGAYSVCFANQFHSTGKPKIYKVECV